MYTYSGLQGIRYSVISLSALASTVKTEKGALFGNTFVKYIA